MDQYFERMYQLSSSVELLARIRFMLQDVLDLRAANWVPRKIAQVDGPRTIRQVRKILLKFICVRCGIFYKALKVKCLY